MGPRLAFWMAVGREMLYCFKTSSITQVFITSSSSLWSTERSRVATDKLCKMPSAFIMQRRAFSYRASTEETHPLVDSSLQSAFNMRPNNTEILQEILEAVTMERLTKNKLTRIS